MFYKSKLFIRYQGIILKIPYFDNHTCSELHFIARDIVTVYDIYLLSQANKRLIYDPLLNPDTW